MFKRFALLAAPFALTAAAAQDAPAPAPAEEHETARIVIETELGDITAEIEVERAPVTAANFLRYVDEGRFDGTAFYRAMPLEWGDQPNGLIQAGTQHDPARVLPPTAHEPTSETGVAHVRGALSMARNAPGTRQTCGWRHGEAGAEQLSRQCSHRRRRSEAWEEPHALHSQTGTLARGVQCRDDEIVHRF